MKKILKKSIVFSTPWFEIEEKTIENEILPYYALNTLDYVSILALTDKKEVILVKQYRPILNKLTLEIPSGHIEKHQSPEEAARIELLEETGYAAGDLELLGTLDPDAGRFSNKLWCFFTSDIQKRNDVETEKGITPVKCTLEHLFHLVRKGEFTFALNISILLMGILNNKIHL